MTDINLLFGTLMFLDLSVCCYSNPLPEIGDIEFINECVRTHNYFRSNVNPPASDMRRMSWDHDLAKIADAWAQKCYFFHNPYTHIPIYETVGENIWTSSGVPFNVTMALTSWYDEVKDYDYDDNLCSRMCGHYTQMIWSTSDNVGCAVHFCPNVSGFPSPNAVHFICNYGPGGNYPGKPYLMGDACSKCVAGEQCIDKLCGEYKDEYKDEFSKAPPSCDKYCILVLALRPSLALLTWAVATFVQSCYPTTSRYD